jgi:sulfur relay protein TusB/DsrH
MSLHLITSRQCSDQTICNFACADDAIVLLDDGVLHSFAHSTLIAELQSNKLYVVEESLVARGLKGKQQRMFDLIDYPKLAELTESFFPIITWY